MARTNPRISAPISPGWWVDDESCICGALYMDFRAFPYARRKNQGERFSEGCNLIRLAAGGYDAGGGFRGRHTVLWALRVIKLGKWYSEHYGCEDKSLTADEAPLILTADDKAFWRALNEMTLRTDGGGG